MEANMKVIGLKIRKKVKVFCIILMGISLKEHGRMM